MLLFEYLKENKFDLSLGAGFFGFYSHAGFLKALETKNLRPQAIFGSSAGAISGACLAAGLKADQIASILHSINKNHVWDPTFANLMLKGEKYHGILRDILPETFEKLELPLKISSYNISSLKSEILDSGDLVAAVRASSAFPILFRPVKIRKHYYLDGGIGDELGIKNRSSKHFLLCHYLGKKMNQQKHQRIKKAINSESAIVHLKGIPASGPNRMHLSKEIFDDAYKKTLKALESQVANHLTID